MELAALIIVAIVALAALVVLDRERTRTARQVSEMASRIQHPDLVSHKAALDYRPPEPELAPDDPELYLAGRVFNGDEPAGEAPSPDPRVT